MSNLNFNRVVLAGHIATEPELKTTKTDRYVADFRMMVNRRKGQDGNDISDAFTVIVWGSTAEFVCKRFHKGSAILVDGSLQCRSYTDSNGNKRWVTEVIAREVFFVDSMSDANDVIVNFEGERYNPSTTRGGNGSQTAQPSPADLAPMPTDSDLPF